MPSQGPTEHLLEIIVIGDELLDGRTHEKNSHYLAQQCRLRGLSLTRVTFVSDDPRDLQETLLEAAARTPLIVTSGGIGPTLDDRTRKAVAKAANATLAVDIEARERLAEKYRTRGRVMNESNLRQAYFPTGATILPSGVGTADAFEVKIGDATVVCLPGVPHEFQTLVESYVLDRHTKTEPRKYRKFRMFGRGESFYADKVEALRLPSSLKITYNAHFPVVDIELSTGNNLSVLDNASEHFARELRPWTFESETRSPADNLAALLVERDLTLGIAESCTGGWVASEVTNVSGASKFLARSVVTYSNDAKQEVLGVSRKTLEAHGAVSEETAKEMVEGCLQFCQSDVAVALTGIAGPTGGSEEKPVGTVFIGVATKDVTVVAHAEFPRLDRKRFKTLAGSMALMVTIRLLQDRLGDVSSFIGFKSCRTFSSDRNNA